MKEKTFRVETVRTRMMCDCGGELRYTTEDAINDIFGSFFSDEISKFKHRCKVCGKEIELDKQYPKTIEIEIPVSLKKKTDGTILAVEDQDTKIQ